MRKTWEWFRERAGGRHAKAWLATLSFSESSFFLVPPDVLLIAMLAAGAGRWMRLALLTTVASLAGALFGYMLGLYVFEPIVQPLIEFYHLQDQFAHVGELYTQSTFWVVLTAAVTPIPFKVFVLAGGFFHVPLIPFMVASLLGRSARFYLVAWLSHRFGPQAAELFLSHFNKATAAVVVVLAVAAIWYFDLLSLVF